MLLLQIENLRKDRESLAPDDGARLDQPRQCGLERRQNSILNAVEDDCFRTINTSPSIDPRVITGAVRPRIAASIQTASWTVRQRGPSESRLVARGKTPFIEYRPRVAL